MEPKAKAVIFDMNGVLIKDQGPLSLRLEKDFHLPADEGWQIIKIAMQKVRIPGLKDSESYWQPLLNRLDLEYEEFFQYWFKGESLNNELLEFIKTLKDKGIKILILSNNFPERTNFYRQQFPELFVQIDKQYFSWETGKVKPDPEAFKQILSDFPFNPGEFIYFDDSESNIEAANSLGIVSHRYNDQEDTENFINSHL